MARPSPTTSCVCGRLTGVYATASEGVRKPRSPSLSNWIAALGIRECRCEEPVGPFLREPASIPEDDLDLGVANLQSSEPIGDESGGHVLELEQIRIAAFHDHCGRRNLRQALHLECEGAVRERSDEVLES